MMGLKIKTIKIKNVCTRIGALERNCKIRKKKINDNHEIRVIVHVKTMYDSIPYATNK